MRNRTILTLAAAVLVPGAGLRAEETAATSRIVSVGLFKNGLAVIKRQLNVAGPGTYRLDDVPEPVHGTYWIESDAAVESMVKMREVETPNPRPGDANLQDELAGKKVTIHLHTAGAPPVSGTVLETERDRTPGPVARPRPRPWGAAEMPTAGPGRFLVLQTPRGRSYVDAAQIAHLEVEGRVDSRIKQRKPVLLLTVGATEKKPATVLVSYLSRGLSWAPSYRVDISDPKTLALTQSAIVKNELVDLDSAEVFLISGFPSVQFAHVTSPLAARVSWASFFQELSQRAPAQHNILSNAAYAISQQVAGNNEPDVRGLHLGAEPTGEGVDLHYQPLGKRTLAEGDTLALTVGRQQATYDRIVEWFIPDSRGPNGQYLEPHQRGDDEDRAQDAPWDALRFKNPFKFPMTTGPALVVAQGRFNGQRMTKWVNAGEETVLHVTKALSVRTRSVEHEEQKNGEATRPIEYIGSRAFRRATVGGELVVSNHRKEAITLVLRRRFSGDLLAADDAPKVTLLEEGVYSVNKRNELVWNMALKPGEEKKLTYRYSVLVHH
jgi:hypothetical protein